MTLSNDTEETSCACHTIINIIRIIILTVFFFFSHQLHLYLYVSASRALKISLDFVSQMQSRKKKDIPSFPFLLLSILCVWKR